MIRYMPLRAVRLFLHAYTPLHMCSWAQLTICTMVNAAFQGVGYFKVLEQVYCYVPPTDHIRPPVPFFISSKQAFGAIFGSYICD